MGPVPIPAPRQSRYNRHIHSVLYLLWQRLLLLRILRPALPLGFHHRKLAHYHTASQDVRSIFARQPTVLKGKRDYYLFRCDWLCIVWHIQWIVGNATLQKSSTNTSITDGNGNYSIAGATYGVFSDKDCTNQLATFTTDSNGNTETVEVKAGTVYIKELFFGFWHRHG